MGANFEHAMRAFLSILGMVCFAMAASAADPPKANKITYQDHILPILREKCLSCHDGDKVKGGLDATTHRSLMEGGSSGVVVKPGDPDGSRLFQLISRTKEPFMPPMSDKLPQAYLDTIRQWIAQGALENSGSKAIAAKPKMDVGLTSVVKGRPEGPPPMPEVSLNLQPVVVTKRSSAITALACSPWAPLIALAGQKQVVLYNSETLQLVGILPFPYGMPQVVKFSRNGSLLLAGGGRGGQSGKVVVWSVKTGERIIEVGDETETVLAADISADQTQIALGGPNKMIRIFSTKDGEKIREIKKHTDWIYTVEYSPDGVLLATADRAGGMFVWEAFTGREYFSLRGHTGPVTDVSWRMDSNVLASGSEDGTIRLWEMENGNPIKAWGAGGGVQSVKFSHDGRLVSACRDRLVRIWDQNGAQQKIFEAFPDVALRAAFTHDMARVVAGDWTGLVRVFIAQDAKPAGNVTPNPPPPPLPQEAFDAAVKELTAKQTAYEQAQAAAAAAQAAATKANADLAAAQKIAADQAAAVKNAEGTLPQAKAAMDTANAAVPVAQAKIPAKELGLKAFTEALQKVKDAADKAKGDANLQAEVQKAQQVVTQATTELDAVKKAHADAMALAKANADKYTAASNAFPAMKNNAMAAAKDVEAKSAALNAANANLAATQTQVNQASAAALAAGKVVVEKYKALPLSAKK
ncbi:MAG TPA: c-type cytochrome domain-containing protein [Gemmataceae bacterium]|jgi:hypothetical protein|nr:c-type cytochrome domain-containing protein [Gemmataceae bacterium]